ncbi:hypothetical protein PAXINDRAFT_16566 [Paxillus involutus ATCC 200175]|uniref:Uncharacterized protein n=1 Tax=Paxillus involutus ATCC 200175 TaxID=664439 RepID=A0A0C9TT60_PAXIN|nr:hypothetical protein PAXINDRAFT_16566 [Paxillus involutus ATCC 200175]
MPLKGEKTSQQSSRHADKAATHLEVPTDESTTTPPVWTPPDEKSSREGRGMAMSHREVAGARDSVEGRNNEWYTPYRVNDERSRKGAVGGDDEAEGHRQIDRDDEEGQENREEDEHDSPAPAPPPSPPPLSNHTAPPAPSPNCPERQDDDSPMELSKTAARRRADAVHDPGGKTDSTDSKPPSPNDVKTDDHDDQPMPRGPVGTPDGDLRCPNGPTEPPDEEKGARTGNSEMKVDKMVKTVEEVETEESSQDDEQTKSKEVEGEAGDQNGKDDCQPDGRTNGTGDATNSVKASSGTVGQT